MFLTNWSMYFHSLLRSSFSCFLCSYISLFVCCLIRSVDCCFVRLFSRLFLRLFLCLSYRALIHTRCLPMGSFPLEAPVHEPSCRPLPETNATKEEKHINSRTSLAKSVSLRTIKDSRGCFWPPKTLHKIIRFQYKYRKLFRVRINKRNHCAVWTLHEKLKRHEQRCCHNKVTRITMTETQLFKSP